MSVELANWIVSALGVYAGTGIAFALAFVTVGVGRIDPIARRGTFGFRVLIAPGAAALWPLLLVRWARGATAPVERNAHRRRASEEAGR